MGRRSGIPIPASSVAGQRWLTLTRSIDKTIADGGSILRYLNKTAAAHHIDKHVQFHTRVTDVDWRTEQQRWRVTTRVNQTEQRTVYARFIVMSTGYYDYDTPLQATIPGLQNFAGKTVHPQFWPEDLDYTDKKIVVIGSGATAVTLLPSLADRGAKHVTMLQRSPSYFIVLPGAEAIDLLTRKLFPLALAYRLIRLRMLLLSFFFIHFCYLAPWLATKLLRAGVKAELPKHIPVDPHFVPSYNPFEQRVCITPDGDFFRTLRDGKGDIATGHIETIQDSAIVLKSGQRIEDVDIIVTATGLQIKILGGVMVSVDGERVDIPSKYVWRNACLQDVPNVCYIFGYTDNAWTLGSDSSARLFVRLMKKLERTGNTSFVPVVGDEEKEKIVDVPLVNLSSGYIAVARQMMPKAASTAPWKPRWHYFADWFFAGYGNVDKGLKMVRVSS